MKKILGLNMLLMLYCLCSAQTEEFNQLKASYKKEIKLPVVASEISNPVLINKMLLNRLLFDKQKERAKFYTEDGKLVKVTTYGRIPEEPFKWDAWADKSQTKRIIKTFETKAYALGSITLDTNYHIWVTKVVGYETTYIDLYVFDNNGNLKSLVNLYEAEYELPGDPSNIASIYITSTITENGTIEWKEERYNVKTTRVYQLQPDGYFKIIKQTSEGEFEL